MTNNKIFVPLNEIHFETINNLSKVRTWLPLETKEALEDQIETSTSDNFSLKTKVNLKKMHVMENIIKFVF